ncbi:MAG: YceD family protein [Chitinophagales bacterium]
MSKDDNTIDISQFLYDFIHLSIPVSHICDNPGKYSLLRSGDIAIVGKQQGRKRYRPRWADLNKLKDKLN